MSGDVTQHQLGSPASEAVALPATGAVYASSGLFVRHLPGLDGWRALAVSAVVLCHATVWLATPPLRHETWARLTRLGAHGVDAFFVLSGLLITGRLLEEQKLNGAIRLRSFYIRRAARILPAALLYLLAMGVVALLGVIRLRPVEWWSALLFFRNDLPHARAGDWYTGHFWSLAIEEQFYLVWPTLVLLVSSRRLSRRLPLLLAAFTLWRWWAFQHLRDGGGMSFYERSDIRLDGLAWGALLAVLLQRGVLPPRTSIHWLRAAGITLGGLYAWVLWTQPRLNQTLEDLCLAGLLGLTIMWPQAGLVRLLELPPLRWLGRLSYSLYLWQQFCFPPARLRASGWCGRLQGGLSGLLVLFLLASGSYYLLERRCLKAGQRKAATLGMGTQ
ncbi:MAG: acyltransferase family protein [Terriglobales bacterium]